MWSLPAMTHQGGSGRPVPCEGPQIIEPEWTGRGQPPENGLLIKGDRGYQFIRQLVRRTERNDHLLRKNPHLGNRYERNRHQPLGESGHEVMKCQRRSDEGPPLPDDLRHESGGIVEADLRRSDETDSLVL